MVRVAAASGGTSYSVSVAEPVAAPCGSTVSVYVPATGSTRVSTNVPDVEKIVLLRSELPSGFVIDTYAIESVAGPTFRLMR